MWRYSENEFQLCNSSQIFENEMKTNPTSRNSIQAIKDGSIKYFISSFNKIRLRKYLSHELSIFNTKNVNN